MKVTNRQLRRLIREAMEDQLPYEDSDSSVHTETEIENSIMRTLENKPGIGGMTLAQRVMGEVPGVDRDSVFSFLDVLLEDGLVFFDDEEDAWYIAKDTPNEVDKEWDIL